MTVVNRLFELINPEVAVFGAKDYQQQILIKKMAKSLHPQLSLLKAPIVRSKNGVALSSRNNYLSEKEFDNAANLFKCLQNSVNSYQKSKNFLLKRKLMNQMWQQISIEIKLLMLKTIKLNNHC